MDPRGWPGAPPPQGRPLQGGPLQGGPLQGGRPQGGPPQAAPPWSAPGGPYSAGPGPGGPGQPGFPPPGPPTPGGPKWLIPVIVGVVALVLLVGIGVFAFAGDTEAPKAPKGISAPKTVISFPPQQATSEPSAAPTATTAPGPEFTTLSSGCSLLSKATVSRLTPGSDQNADRKNELGNRVFWHCQKRTEFPRNAQSRKLREISLLITFISGDASRPGTRSAVAELARDRAEAQQQAGTETPEEVTKNKYGQYADMPGVGDEAYKQFETWESSYTRNGSGHVTVRIRNAIIEVKYTGSDYRVGNLHLPDKATSRPLNEAAAQKSADDIAREVAASLTSCASCTA
jgi:hypothetical protein